MDLLAAVFLGVVIGWMGREALVALDYRDEDRFWRCWQPTEIDGGKDRDG